MCSCLILILFNFFWLAPIYYAQRLQEKNLLILSNTILSFRETTYLVQGMRGGYLATHWWRSLLQHYRYIMRYHSLMYPLSSKPNGAWFKTKWRKFLNRVCASLRTSYSNVILQVKSLTERIEEWMQEEWGTAAECSSKTIYTRIKLIENSSTRKHGNRYKWMRTMVQHKWEPSRSQTTGSQNTCGQG